MHPGAPLPADTPVVAVPPAGPDASGLYTDTTGASYAYEGDESDQTGDATEQDSLARVLLPADLATYLQGAFPVWQPARYEQWHPAWREATVREEPLSKYLAGDFNCDGRRDYRLLMRDTTRNPDAPVFQLFVFLREGAGYEPVPFAEEFYQMNNLRPPLRAAFYRLAPGVHTFHPSHEGRESVALTLNCQSIVYAAGNEHLPLTLYLENRKFEWTRDYTDEVEKWFSGVCALKDP